MALAHTLLSMLLVEPRSGYDLSKEFDEYIDCFWSATSQQIYRELGKMEDQGWIVAETIPKEGRPDKKLYSIQESGKQVLVEWMYEPAEPTPIREDLLVKVKAGYLISKDSLLRELDRRKKIHQKMHAFLSETEKQEFKAQESPSIEMKFHHLTLRRGIRYHQEWVEWCDEAMTAIEHF
jgi:DNA-binding PadR family transcriptional regulator